MFHRSSDPILATGASGGRVYDNRGKEYIDAASGAVVSSIGHGDPEIVAALAMASELDYVHASVFTTTAVETYATAVAELAPVDQARIYPTSGGAESMETALKLARSFHLARGEDRSVVISRDQSYHGNTIGALRISGRPALRAPYEPWLEGSIRVPAVNEYRCPNPAHPDACADWHANRLEEQMVAVGPERVAAFVGESIGGASLAAAPPPAGYWEAIAEVCDRHGVLLIVDEVMTGFGRTGRWFAIEEWDVSPDILVGGKGAGAGYWPLGLCVSAGHVYDTVIGSGGFVHGFTYSHSPIGAAVGMAVLDRIREGDLISAARVHGAVLNEALMDAIGHSPVVGDIRGRGLLIGIEFVSKTSDKTAFVRSDRFTERLCAAARDFGLLVYPAVGCADGESGDGILLAPPLNVTDDDLRLIANLLASALDEVTAA